MLFFKHVKEVNTEHLYTFGIILLLFITANSLLLHLKKAQMILSSNPSSQITELKTILLAKRIQLNICTWVKLGSCKDWCKHILFRRQSLE